MLEARIQQHFFDSADLLYQAAETLSRPIAEASNAVVGCLTAGGKLMVAGVGTSHPLATRLASMLVGPFERDRPALGAIVLGGEPAMRAALGALDRDPLGAMLRPLQALGLPGDVLLAVGGHASLDALKALVDTAHAKDMTAIVLAGHSARALADRLAETDVLIAVPHDRDARLQEVHLLILHALCDAVDLQLMGEQEQA